MQTMWLWQGRLQAYARYEFSKRRAYMLSETIINNFPSGTAIKTCVDRYNLRLNSRRCEDHRHYDDNDDLSKNHVNVSDYYSLHVNHYCSPNVMPHDVDRLIKRLRKKCSPGHYGVTTENFIYGNGPMLCDVLTSVYNLILGFSCVPEVLKMGIVIPILKKPTSNASMPKNYRPITLSSTHAKMVEMLLIPDSGISDTQFGFREIQWTSFGCALLNDVIAYFQEQGSPFYISTLDAEKCFDGVWHDGLLYKLQSALPVNHWLLIYRWYKALKAVVRCNDQFSDPLFVTKGTRQGSIPSHHLFSIFINELLEELKELNSGLCIGDV